MSYANNGDGNLAALQQYEKKVLENEKKFDCFENAVEKAKLQDRMDDVKTEFYNLANECELEIGTDVDLDDYLQL